MFRLDEFAFFSRKRRDEKSRVIKQKYVYPHWRTYADSLISFHLVINNLPQI